MSNRLSWVDMMKTSLPSDSLIQSFQLGKGEIGYAIYFGGAPQLKYLLTKDLSVSIFCLFIESLNKVMHRE